MSDIWDLVVAAALGWAAGPTDRRGFRSRAGRRFAAVQIAWMVADAA